MEALAGAAARRVRDVLAGLRLRVRRPRGIPRPNRRWPREKAERWGRAEQWGEALAVMTVVLETATSHGRRRSDTDEVASDGLIDGVADDPDVVVAWRQASPAARVDLLAGLARYAVLVGVTTSQVPPGSPAHELLGFAVAAEVEPRLDAPLFGPALRRVAGRAAALVAEKTVPDRQKRAACAQLAVALLDRGQQRRGHRW